MITRKFDYNLTEITALTSDTNGGKYIWVGYKKNESNVCLLKQYSAHNPEQVYYELEVSVDEIKDLKQIDAYLYVAVDDSTNIGLIYSLLNTTIVDTEIVLPASANEAPIKIIFEDTDYVYFLLPGLNTENIKIYKYPYNSNSLDETIELTGLHNASSFTIDSSNNIWVVTNESPSKLIRIYDDGGYTWDTTILS